MERKITKNGVTISYELTYKTVKNLNLRVRSDGTAAVSAPKRTPAERIDRFVADNAEKILAAQERMKQFAEKEASRNPVICSGACVFVLGESVTIRFDAAESSALDFSARILHLPASSASDPDSAEKAYRRWLNGYCREVFSAVLGRVHPRFAPYGVPMPVLRVREMKSRWGSCIPAKNTVTLNTRLIAFPLSLIEYVAVHELCHYPEPNHSARFYAWMDRMLPAWRERKEEMRERG